MESRKILFVMSNSSSQKSIMSEAETLGALKSDMRRVGIDYTNMTFFEGRTRTELKDDASVLPTNVPVAARGTTPATTTNELVFMLTTANKKIRSGALSPERKAILDEVKSKNLGDEVFKVFGKNFTQCKSNALREFLDKKAASVAKSKSSKVKKAPKTCPSLETVIISDAGSDKLQVAKVIKKNINSSLKESMDIVDGVPSRIQGLPKEAAAKFVSELIGAGAKAWIENAENSPSISWYSTPEPVAVDTEVRGILIELLEMLIDSEIYGNFESLLNQLQCNCDKLQCNCTTSCQETEQRLSKSDIEDMFDGWTEQ